ncbi:MAG: Ig-like domain-containing protein [Isosphaeraceae bacterium]
MKWLGHLGFGWLRRPVATGPADARGGGRRRPRRAPRLLPIGEPLEARVVLDGSIATYTWIGAGDGKSFNDPNNWSHLDVGGPYGGVGITGVPTPGSNLYFPPAPTLPANSPTTINFNSSYPSFPVNLLTVADSYTFTGNGITTNGGIVVVNPPTGTASVVDLLLSNVTMNRQSSYYVQRSATLEIGSPTDLIGVQLVHQGGVVMQGGGLLDISTQDIVDPQFNFAPQTFEVAQGTVLMSTSTDFTTSILQVDRGGALDVADNAAVKIGSLSGAGSVDLQGTTAANDQTSLAIHTPGSESDTFTGAVVGMGQLALTGPRTLTLGSIDLGGQGSVSVQDGTLDLAGPISAGSIVVYQLGTLGGLGSWAFSGPATFQAGSTFDVTLNGLVPGSQSTRLVSGDSTTGINLGNSRLAGSVSYEYQAGDQFTIANAPVVQGVFQNVASGQVLLGNNIPFAVTYSGTSVTLTALQSMSSTRLASSGGPSHPGQPVTFTASVGTRTAPVTGGTVSFEENGAIVATVPVSASGTATFTTTSLPLGTTSVVAVFGGVGNVLGSTSGSVAQQVVPYTTATAVSSSMNPSRIRQAVTLTATVTADGMPVTSGTVHFTRGSQLLGTAALGPGGTASLTIASLPRGDVRIQAAFTGNPEDFGSVSPIFVQAVAKYDTATMLAVRSVTRPNGRIREALIASVDAIGAAGVVPAGKVLFRRYGRVIGRARLAGGTAILFLPKHVPARGRFVAQYQASQDFGASRSPVRILPA